MNLERYATILWDWNGTLIDDTWLSLAINNDLLTNRGLPAINTEQYRQMFDFPIRSYYTRLGFDLEAEPFELIAEEFINQYEARRFECNLQKNAREVLDLFSAMGKCQNILSATHIASLKPFVAHYRLMPYFTQILGLDNHYAASKIQAGLDWMKKTAAKPKETLLIGDTIHDYEVAKALGADSLIIAGGHQDEKRLRHTGATVLPSLHQLKEALCPDEDLFRTAN